MSSKPFNNFLKLQMKIKKVEYEHVQRARHTSLRVAQMSLATTNVKYVQYATN